MVISSSGTVGSQSEQLATSLDVLGGSAPGGATFINNDTDLSVGGAVNVNSGGSVLSLTVAGDLTQTGGSTLTASGLELVTTGTGLVTLNEANVVGSVAVNATGAVSITNNGGLTVDTVGGTAGITTTDDDVALSVGANDVTVTDTVSLGGGQFTVTSQDIAINAGVTANGGINLVPNASTAISFNGASAYDLTTAELNNLSTTGTVTIGIGSSDTSTFAIGSTTVTPALN